MRNVALVPQQISPCAVNTRHRTAIIGPWTTRQGSTMENVALNHEKCRYCPSSLGEPRTKRIFIKERTRRRKKIVVGFYLFLRKSRILIINHTASSRFQTQTQTQTQTSNSPTPRRRDVMRRGWQSLRNHILDKGYLA